MKNQPPVIAGDKLYDSTDLFEAGSTGQMIETIAQRKRNRQKPNLGMVENFAVLRSNKILRALRALNFDALFVVIVLSKTLLAFARLVCIVILLRCCL